MAKVKLGNIHERSDRPGMFEATYYVNGKRRRALADSREAVTSKVAELIKEAEREPDTPLSWDRDVTLSAYAKNWLENVIGDSVEPRTAEAYKQMLNAHVLPFKFDGHSLGSLRLRDLRRRHIKALLISKRKDRYAKDTVRHIRAALSSMLSDAVDDEIIDVNPALQLSTRKKKMADRKNRIEFESSIVPMTAEEFGAFVESAKDPKEKEYGAFFIMLGKAGLRPSEGVPLLPSDIDEKRKKIKINKSYVINSGRVRPYTKTGYAREVDISSDLLAIMRQHLERQRQELAHRREKAFKKGKPVPIAPEMLFPNRAGGYIDWNNAASAFHRICQNARIGRFKPYALRHTFATVLLTQGAPITYVAAQLGHTKPTTTLSHYAKWVPGERRSYVDLLDDAGKSDASEAAVEIV